MIDTALPASSIAVWLHHIPVSVLLVAIWLLDCGWQLYSLIAVAVRLTPGV